MVTPVPAGDPTEITVVHSPACHFCEDARLALAELAHDLPLSVEFVPCGDAQGLALLAEHRPAMFPLVLVNGAYFSSGRLPRRKLRRLLISRAAMAVA